MPDNVLDTHALGEFLAQYFGRAERGLNQFVGEGRLSQECARLMNRIVAAFQSNAVQTSYVIASTMAFVELVRKWDEIIQGRVQVHQFRAFLEEPPEWFLVAAIDATIVPFYCQLPADVKMANDEVASIEWTDAVHAATALSRNEPEQPRCRLTTLDTRIRRIESVAGDCI